MDLTLRGGDGKMKTKRGDRGGEEKWFVVMWVLCSETPDVGLRLG